MATTPINFNDPLLNNLQANILKGHGRNFAHHLFFELDKTNSELAKDWISQFATSSITSATKQLSDSKKFKSGKETDGGPVLTLSFSSSGYDKLGMENSKPTGDAFRNGMQSSAGLLRDDISNWEAQYTESIDMLIIVADDNSSRGATIANDIANEISSFARLVINQKGNVLKMKSGIGIEHFGYADGISQPLFLSDDINNQSSTLEWNDATDSELILLPDVGASEPNCFGSFLVFRKLEQNVKAFKDAKGDNTPTPSQLPLIKDVDGNDNTELAGAMIVGRFESGNPVVKSSIELHINPPILSNDFDYSDDLNATKCPFLAHTRLMNPRNGDTLAGNLNENRITRRGIPYDEVERVPEEQILKITDELLDNNQPSNGVGLLFMCYQSEIQNQFEILQRFWANQGNIAGHLVGAEDGLISQGGNTSKTLPLQYGKTAQTPLFNFGNFVTMRGGEYFFTPSISFLKSLQN